MEPGLFGIFQRLGGQPDIDQQIAAKLGQAPGQAGGPPASPLNPPAPVPAGGAAPAAGGGAPAAPPTPQAYQTQPDLASLYMQYGRQTQAAQMFNNSLSDMISNFSGIPGGVRSTPAPAGEPAGQLFGNLLKLRESGVQQQQQQAFLRAVPAIAQQLGMTPDEVLAGGPAALQQAFAVNAPTDAVKSWTQLRQVLRNQGLSEDDINIQVPPSMMLGAGLANLGDRQFLVGQQQAIADNKKFGTPIPPQFQGDLANYQAVNQAHAKLLADQANDLAESQAKFGDQTAKLGEVERITGGIENAVEADPSDPTGKKTVSVLQAIMADPVKKAAAVALMNATGEPGLIGSIFGQGEASRLTPEEQTAVANLKQLTSSTYATAFTSTGSRRTQQEVQNIASSLSQLGNLNQPYSSYKTSLDNLHKLNQTGMANAFGAAQRLDEVPDNLKPLVNPIYLPAQFDAKGNQIRAKGPLYTGAGGGWATTQAAPEANTSVKTPEDVAKLPKGTRFIIPDGSGRIGIAPGSGG